MRFAVSGVRAQVHQPRIVTKSWTWRSAPLWWRLASMCPTAVTRVRRLQRYRHWNSAFINAGGASAAIPLTVSGQEVAFLIGSRSNAAIPALTFATNTIKDAPL
jgi:hypothetical protein